MKDDGTRPPALNGLKVQCYAGYRGEQTPRRFVLRNHLFEIDEILDCWLAPTHRYFKVLANDGGIYILRHDAAQDRWDLTLYTDRDYLDGPKRLPRHFGPRPRR